MSTPGPTLHVVVPEGVDDPRRPSGGNYYDRRVCDGLVAQGWSVQEYGAPGAWPRPGDDDLRALAGILAAIPDGPVLADGLLASAAPEAFRTLAARLPLAVLVHLPLGVDEPLARTEERGLFRSCAAVVTTSDWTRAWLLAHYGLGPRRVSVVEPGVDAAAPAERTAAGGSLLVVGPVSRAKGHDVLARALAEIGDLSWRCVCIGSTDGYPVFVTAFRERLRRAGVAERVDLRGTVPAVEMSRAYADADLVVVPSRSETYGMVVTEALAHAVPVIASAVGGVPDALGHAPHGRRPGLLVRAGDGGVLAQALRWWLTDRVLREELRDAASARRPMLAGWDVAAARLGSLLAVLREAGPAPASEAGPRLPRRFGHPR